MLLLLLLFMLMMISTIVVAVVVVVVDDVVVLGFNFACFRFSAFHRVPEEKQVEPGEPEEVADDLRDFAGRHELQVVPRDRPTLRSQGNRVRRVRLRRRGPGNVSEII